MLSISTLLHDFFQFVETKFSYFANEENVDDSEVRSFVLRGSHFANSPSLVNTQRILISNKKGMNWISLPGERGLYMNNCSDRRSY